MRRRKYYLTVRTMPGAEAWVMITHVKGTFKVPADTSIGSILEGVDRGWITRSLMKRGSSGTATIALERLLELEAHYHPPHSDSNV